MDSKVNELIVLRRKKKKSKKIILASILFLCIFIIFLFKAPIFSIKNIKVADNKIVDSNEIIKLSKLTNENNIFYLNTNELINNIKLNPYIKDVSIKRELPSSIIISVSEKPAKFYMLHDDNYLVLNNELRVLEKKLNLDSEGLLEIVGVDVKSSNVGEFMTDDSEIKDTCVEFSKILDGNKSDVKFKKLDLQNLYKINIYSKDVAVKVGSEENLENKINSAINIIKNKDINLTKGYIDLSFKGNPVIKSEA